MFLKCTILALCYTFCPQNKGAKLERGERKVPAVFQVNVPTGTFFDAGSGEGSANGAGRHFAELE